MDTLQFECKVDGCKGTASIVHIYGVPYSICSFHKHQLIMDLEFDKELRNKYLEEHLKRERNISK
jgi:hypothetical protein